MSPKPRTEFAPSDRRRGRAQTTLDFAIGMSVFLIAVTFVFSFIPGMLQPFTGSNEAKTVVADRVADSLAEGMLGDPSEPYILDRTCTIAFFAAEHSDGTVDDRDLNDSNDAALAANRDALYDFTADPDTDWLDHDGDGTNDCNFSFEHLHDRVGTAAIGANGNVDRDRAIGLQVSMRGDLSGDGDADLLCLEANNDPDGDADPDVDSEIVENDDTNTRSGTYDDEDAYDQGGACARWAGTTIFRSKRERSRRRVDRS